jgi:hypothetical protein
VFYVGHFSFEGPELEVKAESRERGWFTCVVEAESVDAAVDEFRELVGSLKSCFTSFESVEAVYLYDVTEVERVPSEGVLARLVHTYDDPPSWIATSLPGVPEEFCRSYGWGPEEPDEDDGNGVEAVPFVSFGEL